MKKNKPAARDLPSPPDPLIDEVRAIRAKISARFGDDLDAYFEHARRVSRRWTASLRKNQKATKPKPRTKKVRKS